MKETNLKKEKEKEQKKTTEKDKLLTLMSELYEHWGLHVLLVTDPSAQCEDLDLGFRKRMYADSQYERICEFFRFHIRPDTFYLYEDDLRMSYSFFRLPDEWSDSSDSDGVPASPVLCIGPVLFQAMETSEISAQMTKLKINPLYQQDLVEFYNYTPIFPSREMWIHTMMFFLQKLSKNPVTFREIASTEASWGFITPEGADYSLPSQPDVALTTIEDRYRAENDLMEAVAAGNTSEAMKRCRHFLSYRLSPRVTSPLRDKKNILFTFNTLLRKSAQLGGVHPLHIDNLSRMFAIQIESAMTIEQLDQISSGMVRKYCILVQNYSRRAYSQLVQTCMNNIDFYYNTELSLSWLAGQCSVSESHLSTVFRKETHMTVTDYINKTRIRQALILLNTTSLPVGEIASRCGFFDANYFSRVFRKLQGQSPKQYRSKIRQKASS